MRRRRVLSAAVAGMVLAGWAFGGSVLPAAASTNDDPFCDNVDYVVSRGPSYGRVVRPGTLVVLGVAARPPGGCH